MTRRQRSAVFVCALACGWVALILGAPWLAASSSRVGLRLSALSYLVGSLVCHQLPARSFHLAGAQLPVCARCTALYVGGACGLVFGLLLRRGALSTLAAGWGWRALLGLAVLPMVLAALLEWSGAWAIGNAWRAGLSLPAGWAAGALVAESLSFRVTL